MKHRFILSVIYMLAAVGCAPSAPVVKKTFYGEARSIESIAIIKQSNENNEFQATISHYAPPPLWIALRKLDQNTVELHVDPGDYVVVLHCATGSQYADPRTTIRARAGTTYEVACERNAFTGDEVRAKVSTTYPNVPATP